MTGRRGWFDSMAVVRSSPHLADLSATTLAHQGGWDEILMVAVPVAIIGLLLVVADKRSRAQAAERANEEATAAK